MVASGTVSGVVGARSKLDSLDVLRGLAAMAVVVFHLDPLMENVGLDIPFAVVGQTGVNVFFVLSGYLIAGSVLSPERFSTRSFMLRRAARILPLYYASMLLVLLFDSSHLLSGAGLIDVALHVTLLHGLSRDHFTSIYAVWWTLSAEWLFYLLMALLAPVFRGARSAWVMVAAFVAVGVGWRFFALGSQWLDRPFIVSVVIGWLDVFAVGMAGALIVRSDIGRKLLQVTTLRWSALALASVGGVIAIWAYLRRSPEDPFLYWRSDLMVVVWPFVSALAVGLLVVVAPTVEGRIRPLLNRSGLVFLGQISYGVYVFHPMVIGSLSRSWRAVEPDVTGWVIPVAVIAATIVMSTIAHYMLERPAMAWAAGRASRLSR